MTENAKSRAVGGEGTPSAEGHVVFVRPDGSVYDPSVRRSHYEHLSREALVAIVVELLDERDRLLDGRSEA